MKAFLSRILKRKNRSWESVRIAENIYAEKIPPETLEKWRNERRARDDLDSLRKTEGFHFIPRGRSGTIYVIDRGRVCEIDWEMSGVPEFNILIFEDTMGRWRLPAETEMTVEEKLSVRRRLRSWLREKGIRADVFADGRD